MTQLPPRVRRLVGYILGLSVSVGIGLAPYLGRSKVPGFTPILALIPPTMQNTVIPLSAALMGIVALVIQWYAGERVSRAWLHKTFKRALLLVLASFLVLIVVHTRVVVTVKYWDGERSKTFVIGFIRPDRTDESGNPICPRNMSNIDCIYDINIDEAAVESHWGSTNIQISKLALILSYLLFMSSFGLLVGLLLIKDERQSGPRHRSQQ